MLHQNNYGDYHRREDWILWEGVEVENNANHIGQRTLFVGNATNEDLPITLYTKYHHVFFNPIFIAVNGFYKVKEILDNGLEVTLSVTPYQLEELVPKDILNRVNIMLCIELTDISLSRLKNSDSVKLQFGNMTEGTLDNITFLMSDAKFSSNEDYKEDIKIK